MSDERFHTLDAAGLAAALAGPRSPFLLDVREPAAYEAGHVPGARNVPVHELPKRPRDLPHGKVTRILVFAEPGKRGPAAANWLALMGYADVAVVAGGVAAYAGTLETGPAPPPPRQGPELRII